MTNKTFQSEEKHQECPNCGTLGIDFDWDEEKGVPIWKCECGAKWKDTRW